MRVEAKDAVAALSELSEMGFTHGFRIQNGRVMDVSTGIPVAPAEVVRAQYGGVALLGTLG